MERWSRSPPSTQATPSQPAVGRFLSQEQWLGVWKKSWQTQYIWSIWKQSIILNICHFRNNLRIFKDPENIFYIGVGSYMQHLRLCLRRHYLWLDNISCSGVLGVLFPLHYDIPDNLVGSICLSKFPFENSFQVHSPFLHCPSLLVAPLASHRPLFTQTQVDFSGLDSFEFKLRRRWQTTSQSSQPSRSSSRPSNSLSASLLAVPATPLPSSSASSSPFCSSPPPNASPVPPPLSPETKRRLQELSEELTIRQKVGLVAMWLLASFYGIATCFPEKVEKVYSLKQKTVSCG